MIGFPAVRAARQLAPTYELEVVLLGTEPHIWRRLQVPGNANLAWLHAVLQVAMGWTNSHLHQFRVGEVLYSDTNCNFAEYEGDPEILDAREFKLVEVAPHVKGRVGYEYDLGDSWRHLITVKRILPHAPEVAKRAVCLGGARACPPEDCGGIWGYAELLKILKNRRHPEHKSKKEWLGGPFDPESFSAAGIDLWLAKLKWPNVTEAHLRKVLMARDGYSE